MTAHRPLLLASALVLALGACSRAPAPATAQPDVDPPIPTAPVEVPAEALEQARQANQVFVTLHAKPGQPALPETLVGGERWVDIEGAPAMICVENTNSTPVLVGLAIQGKDLDQRPAEPGKVRMLEVSKGRIVCPVGEYRFLPDAPQSVAWVVYPTNGQPITALVEGGLLKDPALKAGGQGLLRVGTAPASGVSAEPVEPWPGHPEATPAPLTEGEQAALQQLMGERAKEEAKRRSSPKPEGVEASS